MYVCACVTPAQRLWLGGHVRDLWRRDSHDGLHPQPMASYTLRPHQPSHRGRLPAGPQRSPQLAPADVKPNTSTRPA